MPDAIKAEHVQVGTRLRLEDESVAEVEDIYSLGYSRRILFTRDVVTGVREEVRVNLTDYLESANRRCGYDMTVSAPRADCTCTPCETEGSTT